MRENISQQLGDIAVMYKIPFLAFTIKSITISLAYFTELRASLNVAICMEILSIKYFSPFYFPHKLCHSFNLYDYSLILASLYCIS